MRHHITPPREDDFSIFSAADIARMARGISGTLNYLLTALAGLSLLVGGIVLMNILLISVGERKKEIGVRRALGATQRNIFSQFLMESLAVTLLGMVLGSVLGWAVSSLMARATQFPVVVSWEPFALALGFALVVRRATCETGGGAQAGGCPAMILSRNLILSLEILPEDALRGRVHGATSGGRGGHSAGLRAHSRPSASPRAVTNCGSSVESS